MGLQDEKMKPGKKWLQKELGKKSLLSKLKEKKKSDENGKKIQEKAKLLVQKMLNV